MAAPVNLEQEAEGFATQEAIAATLQHYIDGARTADSRLIRLAFAPTARIAGTYSGEPVEWSVEDFCAIIEKGGPAPELEARIVGIEHSGNAGMARLEARNWRGTRYTDFFVLCRQSDTWCISSKVFFAHSRA